MDSVTNFFWTEENSEKDGDKPSTSSLNQNASKHRSSNLNPNKMNLDAKLKSQENDTTCANSKTNNEKMKTNSSPVANNEGSSSFQQMMTDTLVEKVIKMALPPTSDTSRINIENRTVFCKTRPNLSVPIMSKNCIQMNARLSVPFIMINETIRLFNWDNVPYTLSMLSICTLAILKPLITLTTGPIFYILFGIMVPNYIYVHKPNKIKNLKHNNTPAQGPLLCNPIVPGPVPELSQEFVLNLTDLQNHVLIYVWAYDAINAILKSFAFFINEQISCLVFIVLLLIALFNFFYIENFINWLPVKFILITFVWTFAILLHPDNRDWCLKNMNSEETRLRVLSFVRTYENFINKHLRYVEAKESKIVKIFEIQKYKTKYKEWRTVGFSTDDYSLFSDLRIQELKVESHCSKLLDDVKPPSDWEFVSGSSWVLNLYPQQWVDDAFIQNVEIDSETKWVYDVVFNGDRGMYRRRMWINTVTRTAETKEKKHADNMNIDEDDTDLVLEEVVNPLREDSYNYAQFHGVARGSLSGTNPNSSTISETASVSDSLRKVGSEVAETSVNGIEDMVDILNASI